MKSIYQMVSGMTNATAATCGAVFGGAGNVITACRQERRTWPDPQRESTFPNVHPLSRAKPVLGDWEGDTVVSAGHKGGLLTLVERKTQLAKITKLPHATARATQKAAVRRLKPIGDFVHTITFDNGKEFAAHQDIAHALKTKIFFATPYHAWSAA